MVREAEFLTAEQRDRLLGGNALRFLGLDRRYANRRAAQRRP
ncbi:hypothetical protein [Micromonospora sp. KC213]|nr:hypothetical protein [Micromonospora sp. KC213]